MNPPTCKLGLGIVYSFNISPSDQYQHFMKPQESLGEEDRLPKFTRAWSRYLQLLTTNEIEYRLQTELSEPIVKTDVNQSSRLHFHGYIRFTTIHSLKWFLLYGTIYLSKISRLHIDTIADPEHWYSYVTKQEFLGLPAHGNDIREFYIHGQKDTIATKEVVSNSGGGAAPPPPFERSNRKISKKIRKHHKKIINTQSKMGVV